jgi:hypothetical protein
VALLAVAATAVTAAALPGGGGVRLDGALVPAKEVWAEYFYISRAREFIHPKVEAGVNETVFANAVEQVTNRNLLAREAGRRGISLSPVEVADVRAVQVAAWKGERNFLTALAMLGITEEAYLHRMQMNQLAHKAAEREVDARGAASEEELRAYYRGRAEKYRGKTAALRYLLLKGTWRQPQLVEVAGEAEGLRKAGKSYESLVRERSIHSSAAGGGVVGEDGAAAGGWPHPELSQGLDPGRISRVHVDSAGTHLYLRDILLPRPFEEVAGQVRKDLTGARITETMNSQLAAQRAGTKIELLEGEPPSPPPTPSMGKH